MIIVRKTRVKQKNTMYFLIKITSVQKCEARFLKANGTRSSCADELVERMVVRKLKRN